jgi:hypothetical protein
LDYEYEARKRLYHECEPLVFELLEFAENAGDRIRGLARTARQGDLPDWLSSNDYYIASTMYYLLAPVAVCKLMRRRLTVVNMTLDQNIATQYQLAKQIAWSFADDFNFAWGLKVCELEYTPNDPAWETLRSKHEEQYWRQGLPYGRLDNAVESLIVPIHESVGGLRIMGFGEFKSELHKNGSKVDQAFTIVRDIFTEFHPAKKTCSMAHAGDAGSHLYSDTAISQRRYYRQIDRWVDPCGGQEAVLLEEGTDGP